VNDREVESMEIVKIGRELVSSTLRFTDSLIGTCGPRIPGTEGSVTAAREIARHMRSFCDRVTEDSFTMHPNSLFHIGRIVGAAYVIALILLRVGGICVYIASLFCLLAAAYALIHYFFYGTAFDAFFKKKPGCNAVGMLEPAGEVRRQIVVSGHHDSPYVFNFLTRFASLAGIRFFLAMLFYVFLAALSLYGAFQSATMDRFWRIGGVPLVLALAGLLFTVPLFFFISTKASPGAGDNLNGSSIALHLGRFFAGRKEQGTPCSIRD
jgi:aminopeptidase YwaD